MNNGTQKATQDYQKKNQEGAAGLQAAPDDSMTEAQAAIAGFELWQDLLINGEIPNPTRYKTEFLDFYKGKIAGPGAPFYYMFAGFIGGLDFADQIDKTQEGAAVFPRFSDKSRSQGRH